MWINLKIKSIYRGTKPNPPFDFTDATLTVLG